MADQQQHTGTNGAVEQEPLTGLNLITDAITNGNTSNESNALAEVDPNSVSNVNSSGSINTQVESATDLKQVLFAEPNEKASGVDENLEIALLEGDDYEDIGDGDIGESNMPMGVGEKKKKKKKKKPKSQRGLV